MMAVPGGGIRRGGEHHRQPDGSQEQERFCHASNLMIPKNRTTPEAKKPNCVASCKKE